MSTAMVSRTFLRIILLLLTLATPTVSAHERVNPQSLDQIKNVAFLFSFSWQKKPSQRLSEALVRQGALWQLPSAH